jgi:hypothetical protein
MVKERQPHDAGWVLDLPISSEVTDQPLLHVTPANFIALAFNEPVDVDALERLHANRGLKRGGV